MGDKVVVMGFSSWNEKLGIHTNTADSSAHCLDFILSFIIYSIIYIHSLAYQFHNCNFMSFRDIQTLHSTFQIQEYPYKPYL